MKQTFTYSIVGLIKRYWTRPAQSFLCSAFCLLSVSSLSFAKQAELLSPQEVAIGVGRDAGSVGLPAGTRVKLLEETNSGWKVSCYSLEFVVPGSELEIISSQPKVSAHSNRRALSSVAHDNATPSAGLRSTPQYAADKYRRPDLPYLKRGEEMEVELEGMIVSYPHPSRPKVMRYTLNTFDGDKYTLPVLGRNTVKGVSLEGYDNTAAKLRVKMSTEATGDWRTASIQLLMAVEPLPADLAEERIRYSEERELAERQRVYNPSPNALPFSGTWGVRVPIPTEKNGIKAVEKFDPAVLARQISELTTASYVILNVTQPSGPCYFSGPHPELEKILKTRSHFSGPVYTDRGSFPRRDVLGETLDAVRATGKKTLVYFACEGFHSGLVNEGLQDAWFEYIEGLGMTHYEAVGKLLLKHYADRYGEKIDGWWFDGSGGLRTPQDRQQWRDIVLAANPKAIIAFNRMAGHPYKSTAQCDYFGGHTKPRSQFKFWDPVNLPMVTAIEETPWMNCWGDAVGDPNMCTLGHAFMGMQDRWTLGKCTFPPKQAIDWTTRVVAGGGMFSWAVPRAGSGIAEKQFKLLKKIDQAVAEIR